MLACLCQVPTSFIQAQDGVVRSAPRKGSSAINRKGLPAANRGKTINVNEAFVKAVLVALAMMDDGKKRVFPSNPYLASVTGVKIGSVVHALRCLVQAGFLRKTGRGFKKSKNCWLDWDVIQDAAGYPPIEETPAAPQRAAKPVEVDPVTEGMLDILMRRGAGLGPIGEALPRRHAQPVIKSLRTLHDDGAIRWAITGLKTFQWVLIVQADTPAVYLRKTLNNALAGVTPDQGIP
jgi:hypothetical protein